MTAQRWGVRTRERQAPMQTITNSALMITPDQFSSVAARPSTPPGSDRGAHHRGQDGSRLLPRG